MFAIFVSIVDDMPTSIFYNTTLHLCYDFFICTLESVMCFWKNGKALGKNDIVMECFETYRFTISALFSGIPESDAVSVSLGIN